MGAKIKQTILYKIGASGAERALVWYVHSGMHKEDRLQFCTLGSLEINDSGRLVKRELQQTMSLI